MVYRLSTSQINQNGLNAITNNQNNLNNIISQIGSGLKNDLDPVEKSQQASYTVNISNNAQNMRNGDTVLPLLTNQETTLKSVNEKLIQLQEVMTSAQNPATYDADITKTSVEAIKADILKLVNGKDAYGDYLFSGYKSRTQPYNDLNTYNGDQGVREIRISNSSFVDANIPGEKIVTKNVQDAFKKIESFIASGVNDTSMIDSVQKAIDDISLQQTVIGNNINKITDTKEFNSEINFQNQTRLSQIQDADMASLISQLSQAKTASEASMKSYTMIQGLSLFNYI